MAASKTLDNLTNADHAKLRAATRLSDEVEPRAKSARYDREHDLVVIELKSGVILSIPSRLLQGVASAAPEAIANIGVDARGYALFWDDLDASLAVPALFAGRFGSATWMDELRARGELVSKGVIDFTEARRKGGSARTQAKSAASRENGKKGGRPRTKPVVV